MKVAKTRSRIFPSILTNAFERIGINSRLAGQIFDYVHSGQAPDTGVKMGLYELGETKNGRLCLMIEFFLCRNEGLQLLAQIVMSNHKTVFIQGEKKLEIGKLSMAAIDEQDKLVLFDENRRAVLFNLHSVLK